MPVRAGPRHPQQPPSGPELDPRVPHGHRPGRPPHQLRRGARAVQPPPGRQRRTVVSLRHALCCGWLRVGDRHSRGCPRHREQRGGGHPYAPGTDH
ncbi:hypothetical protein SHJG_8174 [Streptomyces hygroscopicus subsp. jinggangensis 5008]|nr:hypothetical protein SHJG_8174 [Streptomyces hygroscopicus subsp. jinggangensis 5008]AGF67596.1 hypothetical protein SHJGH_7934 [Streptomyces hygroscopicus subsp. jinggangensis TL01]